MLGGFGTSSWTAVQQPQALPHNFSARQKKILKQCAVAMQLYNHTQLPPEPFYSLLKLSAPIEKRRYTNHFNKLQFKFQSDEQIKHICAKAQLCCPGIGILPQVRTWIDEDNVDFLNAFVQECIAIIDAGEEIANYSACAQDETLNHYLLQAMERQAEETQKKLMMPFDQLCDELERSGAPKSATVLTLFGDDALAEYIQICDEIESDTTLCRLDIDALIEHGETKMWSLATRVRHVISMLSLYARCTRVADETTRAAMCEDFWRVRQQQRRDRQSAKIDRASELNVWRIRASQKAQWAAAFLARNLNFDAYLAAEEVLQNKLPRGTFQYIPRRHFSEAIQESMFSENMWRMQQIAATLSP